MTLYSDENIVLHFTSGDRHAAQKMPHDELMSLVLEVAPPEASAALYMDHPVELERDFEGVTYSLVATPTEGGLTVVITEGILGEPLRPSQPSEPLVKADAGAHDSNVEHGAQDDTSMQGRAAGQTRSSGWSSMSGRGLVVGLLHEMAELGASDLHLSSGSQPYMRVHGSMRRMDQFGVLAPEKLMSELEEIIPDKNRQEFEQCNDTDFAYEIEGLSRYRVNVFRDRQGPGSVIRAIPFEILSPEQLGLPPQVLRLCQLSKGLVVVTGPTGSGKSTTLATLIDHINRTRDDHIITVEDPIEFVHPNRRCLVNQREVGEHTHSFKDALRAALREDPDIVLVGEMRDLETIAMAVETAETGHLVFGTLHTTTAASTVDRIIDQFPADQQEQIRQMLASSLRGVIAQNLCRRVGGGRVAAYEILLANKAVANLIRERKTFQILSLMQTGRSQGMRTLTDALMELVREGLVEPTDAYLKAVDKGELRAILEREGHSLEVSRE